jgi:phosphate transport system substrate-binding protein
MIGARWVVVVAGLALSMGGIAACGESSRGSGDLSGSVRVEGSGAAVPLTKAIAAKFEKRNPAVDVVVDRPDDDDGVAIGVANEAIAVILNPRNPKYCIRIEHLAQIWRSQDPISRWSEIPDWSELFNATIRRFGPDPTSDTFDYFSEEVNGVAGAQTGRYESAGEDEDRIVNGVKSSKGAIGYLSLVRFEENQQGVTAVAVESEETGICVIPSTAAVQDGSYGPLSRELFIEISDEAPRGPEARAFVDYYLAQATEIASSFGLVSLGEEQLAESERRVEASLG